MGHDQIKNAGPPGVLFFMFKDHQKIRDERHQFPEDEEIKGVPDRDDQDQGQEEEVVEKPEEADALFFEFLRVADRKEGGGDGKEGNHEDEKCREGVHFEAEISKMGKARQVYNKGGLPVKDDKRVEDPGPPAHHSEEVRERAGARPASLKKNSGGPS